MVEPSDTLSSEQAAARQSLPFNKGIYYSLCGPRISTVGIQLVIVVVEALRAPHILNPRH